MQRSWDFCCVTFARLLRMEWLLAATCFHCCLFSASCPDGQTPSAVSWRLRCLTPGLCLRLAPTPEISDIGIYVTPGSWRPQAPPGLVTQAGTLPWRRGGGPPPAPGPGPGHPPHLVPWQPGIGAVVAHKAVKMRTEINPGIVRDNTSHARTILSLTSAINGRPALYIDHHRSVHCCSQQQTRQLAASWGRRRRGDEC